MTAAQWKGAALGAVLLALSFLVAALAGCDVETPQLNPARIDVSATVEEIDPREEPSPAGKDLELAAIIVVSCVVAAAAVRSLEGRRGP